MGKDRPATGGLPDAPSERHRHSVGSAGGAFGLR